MVRDHYIELVGKVVRLMETLRDQPEGMSLHDLASSAKMVKSSAHRVLQSLMKHGYVEQEGPRGSYHLGMQCLVLARGLNSGNNLVKLARPYLRELLERFDESSYLAVLWGERALFVDVQETSRDLRLVGPLGAEVHYHATAAGKILAAFFDPGRRESLLHALKLERPTARTLASRAQVEREWSKVRRLGYAVNDEETIVGAVFLAAPVFDARRRVCASISVGLPKPRYSARLGVELAGRLRDACGRLSAILSAVGYTHGREPGADSA